MMIDNLMSPVHLFTFGLVCSRTNCKTVIQILCLNSPFLQSCQKVRSTALHGRLAIIPQLKEETSGRLHNLHSTPPHTHLHCKAPSFVIKWHYNMPFLTWTGVLRLPGNGLVNHTSTFTLPHPINSLPDDSGGAISSKIRSWNTGLLDVQDSNVLY